MPSWLCAIPLNNEMEERGPGASFSPVVQHGRAPAETPRRVNEKTRRKRKSLAARWRRRRDLNFIFPVLLLLFCLFPVYLCPNYKIYKLASHRLGTFPLSLSVFLKGKHKGKLSESSFTREAQFSITNKALAKFTSYVRLFNNLNYIFQLKRCSFPLRVPFIPW